MTHCLMTHGLMILNQTVSLMTHGAHFFLSYGRITSACKLLFFLLCVPPISCFTYTTSWPPKPSPTMMWVPYFSMKLLTIFRKSEISLLQWIVHPLVQEMETAFGHGKSSGLCCFCLVSASIVTCSENWSSR